MLNRITQCLTEHQQLTVEQLASMLASSPAAIEGMLALLVKRGQISTAIASSCRGGCGCSEKQVTRYQVTTRHGNNAQIGIINVS